jgi:hypothetical protein
MKRLIPLAALALLAHGAAFAQFADEFVDEFDDRSDDPAEVPSEPFVQPLAGNKVVAADGKELPGTLSELVAGAAGEAPDLVLLPPPPAEALTLKQANVLEVRQDASAPVHGEHHALLTLNNRDVLRGELLKLDGESITLRTRFAGDLKFRRDMVDSLNIVHRPASLYSGPKPGDFTFTRSQGWSQEGNSLVAKGGRASGKMVYPARFRLALDIEWKLDRKSQPRFSVIFLAKENDGRASGGYEFFCQGSYVDMRTREGFDVNESLGERGESSDLFEKDKLRLELLVDTHAGLLIMLVDGRIVQEWSDPTPLGADGANILELAAGSGGQHLRVSSITLAKWDGNRGSIVAEDPSKSGDSDQNRAQRLILRNGDIVQASKLAVDDGKVSANTAHGDILIPLSRVSLVGLQKPAGNPPTPKKRLGDVRAWLPDGSRLTFRLDELKDGQITGSSQQFGTAKFDLKAFERIEMNLGNLDLEPKRPRLNW